MSVTTWGWLILAFPLAGSILIGLLYRVIPAKAAGAIGTLAIAAALFIELSVAVLGSGLKSLGTEGATIPVGFGSPEAVGKLLLERFLIPFEAASLLLLIAAVGAVVLAARRPDPESPIERESAEGTA